MAHWGGAVMTVAGIWMLWSAFRRRAAALAAAARGESPPPLSPALAPLADIGPGLITFGLVVGGGQVVLAWVVAGSDSFSAFDLAGLLFLLVAYGVWVRFRTRYRLPR
jgi:hypothetical protein